MERFSIDLFAGCGGLSLGLENSGFQTAYVNELDSDAMESFLINRDEKFPWLREKFHSYDIYDFTKTESNVHKTLDDIYSTLSIKRNEIDLVVGGPPCQGYSAIGGRRSYHLDKEKIPSNYLYKEMIKVISLVEPKAFLFENVAGLLTSKWTKEGQKGEIWSDVLDSFKHLKDYFIDYKLLKAKDYGVPQNRPRIIMIGIHKTVDFKPNNRLPASGLLPEPCNNYPHPEELLGDLVDEGYESTMDEIDAIRLKKVKTSSDKTLLRELKENLSTSTYPTKPLNDTQKHFRTRNDGSLMDEDTELLEQEYSTHLPHIRNKFTFMIKNQGKIPKSMKTKKFAQRVLPKQWDANGPNITTTSLPDDFVHFSQPRSLTVREWARLQTFPDYYKFAGKRTTGGSRRAGNPLKGIWERETPKYTQIGNAVPVKLAEEIGKHLMTLIS